ncbi:DUF3566 domain-containing protein [Nocardioides sp. CFH 31398]|uniref:DUF3566 domain-containing protein n=1 Tax=Nocardioides sp. CFH 31398 TaxID=2919579 RepID=UPI001F05A550|nr:DUF3566 domain-containing protein [Nocardioides sp. CFH 31398]MCH1865686.1 DUF3566 domain-containing protein [Nocardioides sp. CFH 31398]
MAAAPEDRSAPPGPGQQTAQRPPRPPAQQAPPTAPVQQQQARRPEQPRQAPPSPQAPQGQPASRDEGREDTAVRPFTQRVAAAVSNAARPPQKGESRGAGAALVTGENRAVQPRRTSQARPPRRARLRLTRVDPWSVTKTSFLLSIAFGVVTLVAVLIVWSVLGAAGVWESINATVASVLDGESSSGFDVENYVGTSRILAFTTLVTILNVFLITAVATLGAFMYNLAAALLGGVEVTLAEDEK